MHHRRVRSRAAVEEPDDAMIKLPAIRIQANEILFRPQEQPLQAVLSPRNVLKFRLVKMKLSTMDGILPIPRLQQLPHQSSYLTLSLTYSPDLLITLPFS